ncbi:MAG: hypothetical protein PHD11_09205 [Bacteroidales bacterium]|nr:hypothetical protein [Bacteroidales bacterium]
MKDIMNTDDIMKDIKSLVDDNAQVFDNEEPAKGHFERFLVKMDSAENEVVKVKSGNEIGTENERVVVSAKCAENHIVEVGDGSMIEVENMSEFEAGNGSGIGVGSGIDADNRIGHGVESGSGIEDGSGMDAGSGRSVEAGSGKVRREIRFNRSTRKSGSKVFWRAISFPIAASLMLVFAMNLFIKQLDGNKDYFAGLENPDDPYEVYESYINQVGKSYELLANESYMMTKGTYDEFMETLNGITSENEPLYESLPEDMSDSEKAKILKEYYKERLQGVNNLNHYVADYLK